MSDPTPAKVSTQFRSLFCSLVLDPELVVGQVLSTEWIAEVVAQEAGKTCVRIFTPLATLAFFLGQVFSDDHSCRPAVARLLAWRSARGLPECSPDCGGYCEARPRLSDTLLPRLTRESADRIETQEARDCLFHGRRVIIDAGSSPAISCWPTPTTAHLTK